MGYKLRLSSFTPHFLDLWANINQMLQRKGAPADWSPVVLMKTRREARAYDHTEEQAGAASWDKKVGSMDQTQQSTEWEGLVFFLFIPFSSFS